MENNDEIDLLELFKKSVQWILRNFKLLGLSIILGGGIGFCYYFFSPKIYESKMLVSSEMLTEQFCLRVFGELNKSIKEKNFQEVAGKLGFSYNEASLLKSIRVENSIKEKAGNQEKNFFLIEVRITDQSILTKLQMAITSFILNNNYIKLKVDEHKKLLGQIGVELESLVELKSRIYKGDLFEKAKGNVMFDPTEINTKSILLNEQKAKLERELSGEGIQLVQSFSKPIKPVWPRPLISIGIGVAFGLFIFLVFMIGQYATRLAKAP
jgi:hypothetical protein